MHKRTEDDLFQLVAILAFKKFLNSLDSHRSSFVAGVSIYTSTYGAEGNAFAIIVNSQLETWKYNSGQKMTERRREVLNSAWVVTLTGSIATGQIFLALLRISVTVNRPNCVNDLLAGKFICSCNLCRTRITTIKRTALLFQQGASCTMNCTIYPPSTEQWSIGGIDNSINFQLCKISTNKANSIIERLGRSRRWCQGFLLCN